MTTPSSPPVARPPAPTVDLDHMQATLAAEIGVGLLPLPDILKRFELTKDQLKLMLKDPQFRNMVRQFKREWNEASNSKERIRLKAALMVEDNLLALHQMFNNIDMNPGARLDAFKHMVNLADVTPRQEEATGPKFQLTLNMGEQTKPVTIEAESIDE